MTLMNLRLSIHLIFLCPPYIADDMSLIVSRLILLIVILLIMYCLKKNSNTLNIIHWSS